MHARISPDIRGLSIALAVCMLLALLFPVRAHAQQNLGQTVLQGAAFGAGMQLGQAAMQAAIGAGMPSGIAQGLNWASPDVADIACTPYVIPGCPYGTNYGKNGCDRPDPNNKNKGPCVDPRGPVIGICVATKTCKGMSYVGLGGQTMGLGGALGGIVGQLMSGILQQLMQQNQNQNQNSYTNPGTSASCTIYSQILPPRSGNTGGTGGTTAFSAAPITGGAPLTVTFRASASTGERIIIDFGGGGGRGDAIIDPSNADFRVATHTYSTVGTSTAKAYKRAASCSTTSCEREAGSPIDILVTKAEEGVTHLVTWTSNGATKAVINPPILPIVKPGTILERDYFCITNLNPLTVIPVGKGTPFPANCFNDGSSVPLFGSQEVKAATSTVFFLSVNGTDGITNTCSTAGGGGLSSLSGYSATGASDFSSLLSSLNSTNLSSLLNSSTLTGTSSSINQLLNQFVNRETSGTVTVLGVTATGTGGPSIRLNIDGKIVTVTAGANGDMVLTPESSLVTTSVFDNPGDPTRQASTGVVSTSVFNIGGSTASLTPQGIVEAVISPFGARGDITVLPDGTTIVAGTRNANTEVAGFVGGNTFGESSGLVSKLCTARPWANNFLSYIVPPSFFDNLCTWRGYKPGGSSASGGAAVGTGGISGGGKETKPDATIATSTPTTEPKVAIWAVPPAVRLGARTSIFWNSQGVRDCLVTSPDGSFRHTTLSGGGSTVPITAETVFTISCVSPEGKPFTDYITVKLAI